MTAAESFDVAVAGAGMVGACAALALARQGLRVALIEAAPPPEIDDGSGYDLRVSAISPGSRDLLTDLGVWPQLDPGRICQYQQMRIWHQPGAASVALDAVELARDDIGAIVENRLLQRGLHQACRYQPAIRWFMPDRIVGITRNDADGVEVKLMSGESPRASLLLVADGRGSPTRRLAGIELQGGSYRQRAIIANVDTGKAHGDTAWQRFLLSGPLAFLPLANGQSSIVWSCDNDLAADLEALAEEEFCARLGAAFEYRLGEVIACGERRAFALGWQHCERWLQGRILLIGDAAHAVHPLAGQGVNLGFTDVELLTRLLAGRPAARWSGLLRRFERRRKSDTWLATQGFSALNWLYGQDNAAIAGLRDAGMRAVDSSSWVKRLLMQKAIQNLT